MSNIEITPEEALAAAIDTIQTSIIVLGSREPSTDDEQRMVFIAQRHGAPLRAFQRHGISSILVARALRDGLLAVKPREVA
jgi:hypothetical protein